MLKPGYTSIQRVIENVIRDTGFTTEINWIDVIEWVYIASELIGVKNAYVLKVTDGVDGNPDPIEIKDYRGELPADFHLVYQIRDNHTKTAMRCDSGTFLLSNSSPKISNLIDLSYAINHDFIFTSFKDGYIEMTYYAFPIDEQGLPLIPDDVMYIRAIEAYITERIARKLMIQDKMDPNKYRMLEQDWLFYVNSARTKDSLMSLDQAHSLRNQITKITNAHEIYKKGFSTLGRPSNVAYGDEFLLNKII
jgi:hypothetical protein